MAESKFASQQNGGLNGFKEAVCINAGRIYDSCSEKHYTSVKARTTGLVSLSFWLFCWLFGILKIDQKKEFACWPILRTVVGRIFNDGF